jgi:hypothetical protein
VQIAPVQRRLAVPRAVALAGASAVIAACLPATGAARPLPLPSPTLPLDSKVPLRSGAPPSQLQQLPLNARVDSREQVIVDALAAGSVVGVQVLQRLTLVGTGDYFFTVPAPLLDVRAGPGSQAEPGFRRSAVVWQGFANRRRVLAADAELDPEQVADALPLRLELRATVDGRPLESSERRSGRLQLELRLRNTTAVRAPTVSARPVRAGDVRRIVARIASQVRKGETPDQPTLEVEGPIETRRVVVDAPLAIAGELRLRASGLEGPMVSGGSLVRRRGGVAVRFRLVLAGPERSSATIRLNGSVRDAASPRASLTADPSAAAAISTDTAGGGSPRAVADAAGLLLLRLARVRQYDAFLANPAAAGSVQAVYRFRTVDAAAAAVSGPASDDGSLVLPAVVLVLVIVGASGLVVLWAHL